MALFLRQNEQRTQLQEKVAADLAERLKTKASGGDSDEVGKAILDDSHEASGRSLLVVGAVTVAVIALVILVLVLFHGA